MLLWQGEIDNSSNAGDPQGPEEDHENQWADFEWYRYDMTVALTQGDRNDRGGPAMPKLPRTGSP